MSFRTAVTTTDTSGASLFQSAYIDAQGNIISFSDGETRVDKYWKASTAEVLYKRIEQPLLFLVGDTTSYTFDGTNLNSFSHSSLGTSFRQAIMFKGKYYVIDSSNVLKVSSNLTSWSSTGEYAVTMTTDGNTLAIVYPSSATIRYTSDGTTWSTKNSWTSSPSPLYINAIRYIEATGFWVAVGVCDDTGSSGNYKPWTARVNSFAGVWDEYALTTAGDGDTSFLDISYNAGNYTAYAYVGANSDYINLYTSSSLGSWGTYPDSYTSISHTTDKNRASMSVYDALIATPNGRMVAPIAGYEYLLAGSSNQATWQSFPAGQDKNGKAYTITWDNTSSTTNFVLIDDASGSWSVPSDVYAVGGYR